jgi:hypothetical protein
MADENDFAVHAVNGSLGKGDVFRRGFGRVLHHLDVILLVFQNFVEARPARVVHKAAVNEDNGLAGFGAAGVSAEWLI